MIINDIKHINHIKQITRLSIMELSEIWIGIIIPIIIGPIFIYLKTLRDEIAERKYNRKKEIYKNKLFQINELLENFYWPLYISLISIQQYSYHLPIKNRFRYDSNSSSDKQSNEDESGIDFKEKSFMRQT